MDAEAKEYWRWEESSWVDPDFSIEQQGVLSAGIDVGSTSTQAVIMQDGKLIAWSNIRTGNNSPESADNALKVVLDASGISRDQIAYLVGTGYGRVNVPGAQKTITEIACHAKGANYVYGPTVRTILDMGGQDCKAIRCDEKGRVVSFLMNDKCAAGTGRGMEAFADLLRIPIGEVGERSLMVDEEPEPVSSTCVVYAKTEAQGLLRAGWSKEQVLAAYCAAMAKRVAALLRRNGVEEDFAITGGIAKNKGIVVRVERILGIQALEPKCDTQIIGAIGAALFAYERALKQQKARASAPAEQEVTAGGN